MPALVSAASDSELCEVAGRAADGVTSPSDEGGPACFSGTLTGSAMSPAAWQTVPSPPHRSSSLCFHSCLCYSLTSFISRYAVLFFGRAGSELINRGSASSVFPRSDENITRQRERPSQRSVLLETSHRNETQTREEHMTVSGRHL